MEKTAMQMLLEKIESIIKNAEVPDRPLLTEKVQGPYKLIKKLATELLDTVEKEQTNTLQSENDRLRERVREKAIFSRFDLERAFLAGSNAEDFEDWFQALTKPADSTWGGETIGSIISKAVSLHELKSENIDKQIGLPIGTTVQLMNDECYVNSVPVLLFRNLIISLHIPFDEIESAMIPTFKLLLSKETEESKKKKPLGFALWENEESVIKYTKRLKELSVNSSGGGVEKEVCKCKRFYGIDKDNRCCKCTKQYD